MNRQAAVDGASIAAAVDPARYQRLLGLPPARPLDGVLAQRADQARDWYALHGRPYLWSRRLAVAGLDADAVHLEGGMTLASTTLAARLHQWRAHAVLGLAASAGAEVDEACARLWQDERPDEAFFLERFAVAVVEQLVFVATLGACRQASGAEETVTAHLSPGCGAWDIAGQHVLWQALFAGASPGPLRLLDSGALSPKCSVLAAAGLTRRVVEATPADACRACDLPRCAFRRAAHRGAA